MALADFGAKVITTYEVKTDQARAQVKKLKGEEQKLAKQRLSDMERHNSKLEKQIATIGKVGLAVGAAAAAWQVASKSLDVYVERSDLRLASQGAQIGKLQDAFNDLVNETESMRFAASLMNTEFEISQGQMEMAARAVVSLKNQGNDLVAVQNAVTKALVEGNVEGLRPFGIVAKGATGTTEGFEAALAALQEQANSSFAAMDSEGDKARQAMVRLDDATTRLTESVGKLVAQLAPAVELLAGMVEFGADVGETFFGGPSIVDQAQKFAEIQAAGGPRAYGRKLARERMQERASAALLGEAEAMPVWDLTGLDEAIAKAMTDLPARERGGGGGAGVAFDFGPTSTMFEAGNQFSRGREFGGLESALPTMAQAAEMRIEFDSQIVESANKAHEAMQSVFGNPDQFLTGMDALSRGFGLLEQAATAALDAWIDGTIGMGEAIQQAVSQGAKAFASEALIQGLRNTALGIAAAANPFTAAQAPGYFKAAAAWGAAGAAAAVVAKATTASPQGAPTASGGAAAFTGGGAGGGGGEGTVNNYFLNTYQLDDERRMARRATNIVDRGRRQRGGRSRVRHH